MLYNSTLIYAWTYLKHRPVFSCLFPRYMHGAADSPDTTSIPRWTFKSSQSSTLPKSIEEVLMCSALMCLRCICCFPVLWIRPSLKPLWKHTACGAAKSHPVEERKRASQHQTAHCCQCATLPHATTNQYQCITIETTWINTLLMAFVYSAFLSLPHKWPSINAEGIHSNSRESLNRFWRLQTVPLIRAKWTNCKIN